MSRIRRAWLKVTLTYLLIEGHRLLVLCVNQERPDPNKLCCGRHPAKRIGHESLAQALALLAYVDPESGQYYDWHGVAAHALF